MIRFVIMNENDSVATALDECPKGCEAGIFNSSNKLLYSIIATENIPFGNKIALKDMECGTNLIKYDAEVGEVTRDIKKGELVHVHNVKSLTVDIPQPARVEIMRQMGIK